MQYRPQGSKKLRSPLNGRAMSGQGISQGSRHSACLYSNTLHNLYIQGLYVVFSRACSSLAGCGKSVGPTSSVGNLSVAAMKGLASQTRSAAVQMRKNATTSAASPSPAPKPRTGSFTSRTTRAWSGTSLRAFLRGLAYSLWREVMACRRRTSGRTEPEV